MSKTLRSILIKNLAFIASGLLILSCSTEKKSNEGNQKKIVKVDEAMALPKQAIEPVKVETQAPEIKVTKKEVFEPYIVVQSKDLYPEKITPLEFTKDMIENFNSDESFEKCKKIWSQLGHEGRSYDDLTQDELNVLKYCSETKEDIWDIVGSGCSWYCGGGPYTITASSFLPAQGKNQYLPQNAHDLDFENVWVEGVDGYGIGEYLEYTFKAESPRIHTIIVVNGYVKSPQSYYNNSRVKTLNVYYDNDLYAQLHLKDTIAEQYFPIDLLGYGYEFSENNGDLISDWQLRFEIEAVYQGEKWDDVVITEIYFDGTDVHCFAKGTLITMADSTEKPIEEIKVNDYVLSYNTELKKFEKSKVLETASPTHQNLVEIGFSNNKPLVCTKDHPILLKNDQFASILPSKTMMDYKYDNVKALQTSMKAVSLYSDEAEVSSIKELSGQKQTYTIVKLDKNNTFVANRIIVGTGELK